ncbi:hypothetical protein JCM6882_006762 [Rhodosporidiobolus microsporus]
MLLRSSTTPLRAALRFPTPSPLLLLGTRHFHPSRPSYASPALSADVDHYAVLGLKRDATRNQIKERFYELSRKHHPDAPSTSSESPDQRLAKFQQLSNSYSILSDPDQRRSYDLSRSGSSVPPHRRRPGHHPGYTSASGGMGYSGGAGGGGAFSENDERRDRANYAWQHPKRGQSAGETAPGAAHGRHDPFASRRSRAAPSSADHFTAYAERARIRHAQAAAAASASRPGQQRGEGHHYMAGTSVFGSAKAEEESRLINDSSTLRSGQVAFVFIAVFAIAIMFSPRKDNDKHPGRR